MDEFEEAMVAHLRERFKDVGKRCPHVDGAGRQCVFLICLHKHEHWCPALGRRGLVEKGVFDS